MQRKQRGEEPPVGAKQECDLAGFTLLRQGDFSTYSPSHFPPIPFSFLSSCITHGSAGVQDKFFHLIFSSCVLLFLFSSISPCVISMRGSGNGRVR